MFNRQTLTGILAVCLVCIGSLSADARVFVKEKIKYYTVSGKNGIQIANSIGKNGPKANKIQHAIASTHWDFDLKNPKFVVVGSKCKMTSVDIHVRLTYVYPKWKNYASASPQLKKRWDNFFEQLVKHEKKHGKIFIDGTKGFERSLKRARGKVSNKCEDFNKSLKRHLLPVVRSVANRHLQFDRREGFRWAKVRIAQRLLTTGK